MAQGKIIGYDINSKLIVETTTVSDSYLMKKMENRKRLRLEEIIIRFLWR